MPLVHLFVQLSGGQLFRLTFPLEFPAQYHLHFFFPILVYVLPKQALSNIIAVGN